MNYNPKLFYNSTFLITWVAWFIAAYQSFQNQNDILFIITILTGLIAPFCVALWLTFRSKQASMKKTFLSKLFNIKRMRLRTFPLMIVIMPMTILLSICISLLFGYSTDQFQIADKFSFSAGLVPVFLILFLAASFEELGWRGYAIESLQNRYNYFTATLIFGILWSLWHFPLFFIKDSYQYNLFQENIWFAANFMVSIVPLAYIIGWFYRKNNESILLAILFHFIINISQEAFEITQFTKCIQTFVLIGIAGLIVHKEKTLFFTRASR